MTPPCVVCTKPVDGPAAYGCLACGHRLGRELGQIADFAGDARAVAAGQTRQTAPVRGSGGSRLPINLGAASRLASAQTTITTWARHVAGERGGSPAGADPLTAAARWLVEHVDWMRHCQEFDEFARDVAAVARVIAGIVDKPAQRRYAGPCTTVDPDTGQTCGTDLYARAGRAVATCRECGYEYDVDARHEWMREQVAEKLARPVEIAGILLRLGIPVAYSTVAAYVQHGRVVAQGVDSAGRPLYRIGDVIDTRMSSKPRAELAQEAT